jgi:hypothetical protein
MSVPGLARVRVRESATSPGAAGCSRTNGPGLLAVAVRELRTERGRTIQRFVDGQLRPRPSLLWALASCADPDQSAEVRERLLAAAVPSIVPDKSHARVRPGRPRTAESSRSLIKAPPLRGGHRWSSGSFVTRMDAVRLPGS